MTVSAPARAFGAFKPTASPGLLAASSAIAATFTATPFVIAASADRFDIGIGQRLAHRRRPDRRGGALG